MSDDSVLYGEDKQCMSARKNHTIIHNIIKGDTCSFGVVWACGEIERGMMGSLRECVGTRMRGHQ